MALLYPSNFAFMKKASSPRPPPTTRLLISVSVQGSPGPLRFLVDDDEPVSQVIAASLKMYGRQGRVPFLGSDPDGFCLYCQDGFGCQGVLGAHDPIRSCGARSFLLAKKPYCNADVGPESGCTGAAALKAWLHKPLSFKISSIKLGRMTCAKS